MGTIAARFFTYVQSAALYRDLHQMAVAQLPKGNGLTWLDVGCGPGLVARCAQQHGYAAIGVDVDPAMVLQAQRIVRRMRVSPQFNVVGLDDFFAPGYDVVSAASFLIVMKDRRAALEKLKSLAQPRGVIMIIETTSAFTLSSTWSYLRSAGFGGRNWVMLLWAFVRRNAQHVDESDMVIAGWTMDRHELIPGIAAWLLRPSNSVISRSA